MDMRINLRDLKVDLSYQRDPDDKRVQKIAAHWDDMKANLVHVSRRPDGYYVIDGNHTRLACEKTGRTDILCRVHEGLTKEDEARLFSELNTTSKKPSFAQLLKARARAGYETEKSYLELLDKAGLKYSLINGASGCVLRCHSALVSVYKKTTYSKMLEALITAKDAANNREEFFKSGFFPGMCAIVVYHPEINKDRLVERIRKTTSSKIMEIADKHKRGSAVGGEGQTTYYYKAYVDVYNKNLKKNIIIAK